MKILQVSTHDHFGGAEAIMQALHAGYSTLGESSTMAFGEKHHPESQGIYLDRERYGSLAMRTGISISNFVRRQVPPSLKPLYKRTLGIGFSQPIRMIKRMAGLEDFDHPVSKKLLPLYRSAHGGENPDLLHFHTLHGDFFDLRQLPSLSREVPVFVTLHDEWMMTGHCGYTLDCERWRTGCGFCPALDSYPAISRDATAFNFRRKRAIYQKTKMRVAAPSRWLLERFQHSPMSDAVLEFKHIPNGIDLSIFKPGDQQEAREKLGLPQKGRIFLFAARGGRQNRYKDFQTIERALIRLKQRLPQENLMFVVLGEQSEELKNIGFPIRFEEVNRDKERMALFYQASDLYLHAANAENYPTVILESMACGTPVIATATGGISEQIDSGKDGFLVSIGDFEAMSERIAELLGNPIQLRSFSTNAFQRSVKYSDQKQMIQNYWQWFKSI